MTVDANDRLSGPYSGNGVTTAFAYDFRVEANTELRVILRDGDGVDTTQTLTTHYTVSGVQVDGGGNVTFVTAPASGEKVIIEGVKPLTQTVEYTNNDRFPYDSHQAAIDKLSRITQELRRDVDRAVKFPHGETTYRMPLKPAEVSFLGQNADGSISHLTSADLGSSVTLGSGVASLLSGVSTAILGALDGIKKFATYAAMVAMTAATGLIDNGIYYVAARAATDDGGAGMFQWRAASTTTADGGTVLAHASIGTGRFHRLNVGSSVDIRWFPGGAPGSDCSAAVAAAMGTGKHVYWPRLTTGWVIGSGTAIPAWVSRQWWLTDAVQGAVTTITTTVYLGDIGTTSTRCDAAGIGDGFRIIAPNSTYLLDGIYFRTFTIGRGSIEGVHQVIRMGSASAAGASYRLYNHSDAGQRYGRIFTTVPSGTLTVGRVLTGGTSGATGTITSVTVGTSYEIVIERTSATPFQAAETVTEATSGYTATVSSIYRPDHLFKAVNFAGDFTSDGTVEGAYDGAADGFNADSNVYTRVDEVWIWKYFSRFRRNFSAEDARVVNGHFYADMEGAMQASLWFNVTSSTAKSASAVGFSQIYVNQVKISVFAGGTAGAYFACNRASVELEACDIYINLSDAHTVTGLVVDIQNSTLRNFRTRVNGVIKPAAAGCYGVQIIEGASGSIVSMDVECNLDQQLHTTALAALITITGTPEGIIRAPVAAGTVTARVVLGSTPPQGLRIMETESGVPMGASALYGPDFVAVNITVAAADFDMVRGGAGGVTIWRPEMDILIIGADWEWSTAPTANHVDVKIDVNGSNSKSHTNTGVVTQSQSYWASGAVAVTKGQAVEMYVTPDGTYATANADVVGRIKYVPLWNDA